MNTSRRTKTIARTTAGLAAGFILLTGCSDVSPFSSLREQDAARNAAEDVWFADYIAMHDTDGDGRLSFDERDVDGDGELSFDERDLDDDGFDISFQELDLDGDGRYTEYERYYDNEFGIHPIPGAYDSVGGEEIPLTATEIEIGNTVLADYATALGVAAPTWIQGPGREDYPAITNCNDKDRIADYATTRCSYFGNIYTATDPAVVQALGAMFEATGVTFSDCSATSCSIRDEANEISIRYAEVAATPFTPVTYRMEIAVYLMVDLDGNRVMPTV